jgi:hypothetical protein
MDTDTPTQQQGQELLVAHHEAEQVKALLEARDAP